MLKVLFLCFSDFNLLHTSTFYVVKQAFMNENWLTEMLWVKKNPPLTYTLTLIVLYIERIMQHCRTVMQWDGTGRLLLVGAKGASVGSSEQKCNKTGLATATAMMSLLITQRLDRWWLYQKLKLRLNTVTVMCVLLMGQSSNDVIKVYQQ